MNINWIQKLQKRTFDFALDSIKLFQLLPSKPESLVLGKQMFRAATSVGANYRAACRAKSQADFIYKIKIVVEEADEVDYWLELLKRLHPELIEQIGLISIEAKELRAIFARSLLTAKQNQKKKN
ncbi:MAG: four helix bundle protein [Bacteroidota bacterium]